MTRNPWPYILIWTTLAFLACVVGTVQAVADNTDIECVAHIDTCW